MRINMKNEDFKLNKNSSLAQWEHELTNQVYLASLLIEKAERLGLCNGNGHHAAQNISQFAVEQLKSHWIPEDKRK